VIVLVTAGSPVVPAKGCNSVCVVPGDKMMVSAPGGPERGQPVKRRMDCDRRTDGLKGVF